MLSRTGERGQLTIIRAGVAFPAVYNIGRFHEDVRQRVALLGWGSLAEFGRPDRIESIHATASDWRATAFEAGTERRVELQGDVDGGTGEPRLRRARVIEAGAPAGSIGQSVFFDQPARSDALGRTYARSVTIERTDGIRELYEVMRIERASTSAISAGAAVPAVEPGVVVLDYREPNAPSWAPYAESPRLTWHRRAQGEQYEMSRAPGDAGAGGTTPAGSSGRRLMYAIGLVVVVGGVVPLVLRYIRKR
ncbi:MAG TPA: hypothetical protein VNN12_03420 [Dehalococcoidia bacterium]|nr:hypothetical protein [Dehalococcoidia bacterium]